MKTKVALKKGNDEILSDVFEVEKPGDLEGAISAIFGQARERKMDLWNITLEITKSLEL